MSRNFRIDVGLSAGGTLVGSWDRDFPTNVNGCSISQAAEALLFSDTSRIFQQAGAGTYSAKFFMGNITLSGGFPEDGVYPSVNNLPPGVTPVTAIPQLTTDHPGSNSGFLFTITALGAGVGGSTSATNTPIFFTYNSIPSMFLLLTEEIGISLTKPIGSYGAIKGLFISGIYQIVQQSAPLVTIQNSGPVSAGDIVRIVSYSGGFSGAGGQGQIQGILDGVEQIQLSYINASGITQTVLIDKNNSPNVIIAQGSGKLWFYIPIGFRKFKGLVTVTLIGNGIQFSGSIIAGFLDILFEDASGIYELVKDQTNDVLYFREGFTTDTKLLVLPDMRDEEISYIDEDFFNILQYPPKILAQNFLEEEDYEMNDYSLFSTLRAVILSKNVEIPSPFIKTAFLP